LQPKDLSEDGHIHLVNVKSKKDYDYSLKIENDEIKALWAQRVKAKKMWNDLPRRYWKRLIQFMRHTFGKDENGERLSPHSLRHSFASRAIQNGASLEVVSKLLDHASPSTTLRVYARFSQEQIDDGMRRATKRASTAANNQGSL
jgi:site-specific recombinase XerD